MSVEGGFVEFSRLEEGAAGSMAVGKNMTGGFTLRFCSCSRTLQRLPILVLSGTLSHPSHPADHVLQPLHFLFTFPTPVFPTH